ncbi:hypothetical protein Cenrod_2349 [Candidatus Symbiobacter mobilis CR]|uniref:Uncharacterized protein n=1 Tax=Candidatus Symbiobacter mobilis CR TaxID=946483 RepID=U5NDW7_9BURK|nr:hypothetical protein Cenrod_2349 [Candidatus Symbiobacter mobilis CR]
MIQCETSIMAATAASGFRRYLGTGKSLSFVSPRQDRWCRSIDMQIYSSYNKACISSLIQSKMSAIRQNTGCHLPLPQNSNGMLRWCGLILDTSTEKCA